MSGFGMYTLHSKKGVPIFDNVQGRWNAYVPSFHATIFVWKETAKKMIGERVQVGDEPINIRRK